jgi:hypothetical protein
LASSIWMAAEKILEMVFFPSMVLRFLSGTGSVRDFLLVLFASKEGTRPCPCGQRWQELLTLLPKKHDPLFQRLLCHDTVNKISDELLACCFKRCSLLMHRIIFQHTHTPVIVLLSNSSSDDRLRL